MIDPENVAVVIPTRGNVDLQHVFAPLEDYGFATSYVWDNATEQEGDLAVYGRYAAIAKTTAPVILTLDDDVVLNTAAIDALLAAYEPGVLLANMPAEYRRAWYTDHCLVGLGAIFDRDLPRQAFARFWHETYGVVFGPMPADVNLLGEPFELEIVSETMRAFNRACDVVFTALTPRKLIDAPVTMLDYGYGDDRMYRQQGFHEERQRMLELALKVRDGVAA